MVDDLNNLNQNQPTASHGGDGWRLVVEPRFAEDDPVTPIASFSASASSCCFKEMAQLLKWVVFHVRFMNSYVVKVCFNRYVLKIQIVRSFYSLKIWLKEHFTDDQSVWNKQYWPDKNSMQSAQFVNHSLSGFFPWYILAKRSWTCPFCDLGVVRWLPITGSRWIMDHFELRN